MRNLLGTKILILTAHPDDESYLAAGLIHANQLHGGRNFLVCATAGEQGASHLPRPLRKHDLKIIRQQELKHACECLGKIQLTVLGLPDGDLKNQKNNLLKKNYALAKKYHPDCIVSFGSDGITGHHDHLAVGQVAKKISQQLKIPFVAFALPPRFAIHAAKWLKSRRKNPTYINNIKYNKPNIKIKINGHIKKQALQCHVSQLTSHDPFVGFPDYAVEAMLTYEYFVMDK